MRNPLVLVTVTGALLLAGSTAQAAPVITDLGALPGHQISWAKDISRDAVVGASSNLNYAAAIYWPRAGGMITLKNGGANSSGANAVNDRGLIVGYVGGKAVRWNSRTAEPVTLPEPAGDNQTIANAVNSQGVIAGTATDNQTYDHRAVRWGPGSQVKVLPLLDGHTESQVHGSGAVSDSGIVVGSSGDVAVYWDRDGGVHRLPQLDGWSSSKAHGINRHGVIVGEYAKSGGGYGAVRWDRGGKVTLLPALPGTAGATAADINDAGVVVGSAEGRPTRWDAKGAVTELPRLGNSAPGWGIAINARGEIAGGSAYEYKRDRAVRWTP